MRRTGGRGAFAALGSAALLGAALWGCAAVGPGSAGAPAGSAPASPPVAQVRHHAVESPSGPRDDPYYWLRDDSRTDPDVLAYLDAENAWTDHVLAPLAGLQQRLYDEMVARIVPDETDTPVLEHGWWMYARHEAGKDYPILARRRGTLQAPEQVMLDGNAIAGAGFFEIGGWEASPDGRRLAWMDDHVGRWQFTLRVKDLATGETFADSVPDCQEDLAWMSDNRSVLYTEKDPQTLLGQRVKLHVVGTDPSTDKVVYEEKDDTYYIHVSRSRTGRFVYIRATATNQSEWLYADAGAAVPVFKPVIPREDGHLYDVEDVGPDFVIRSNWQAPDFRIVRVPFRDAADRAKWRDVVATRPGTMLESFHAFEKRLAVNERSQGVLRVRIKPWSAKAEGHVMPSTDTAFSDLLDDTADPKWPVVRWRHSTLAAPEQAWEYDLATGATRLVRTDPVGGALDGSKYVSELVFATARDGSRIPVSLAWRRDTPRDGTAPLYLMAYGSYGASCDVDFDPARLSLLDRGFVVGVAHVRGGMEMGRHWYDDGHHLHKKNTFYDFIDATDWLVAQRIAAPDRVFAWGESAGGILMGAIANLAPAKYRGIVADVPFVDVVTTMLDESIPLTTNEFDEWGDPRKPDDYAYMLSYSPYDNVVKQAYPAMLVTTGLWDSQVQYFEPAKWVAKLRAMNTGDRTLILRVNREASHLGASGRYQSQHGMALRFAFILGELGVRE